MPAAESRVELANLEPSVELANLMPAAESRVELANPEPSVELANPEPSVELANLMAAAESRVELANPELTVELANLMHAAESRVELANPEPTAELPEPRVELAIPEPIGQNLTDRDRYFERCVPLHKAALLGKWEDAERLIRADPSLVNSAITEEGDTALHLAAAEGHVHFVTNLLRGMEISDLRIQNNRGKTALCFAAVAGHVNIAKIMLSIDPNLIRSEGHTPLYYAAWQGRKEMARFLFEESVTQSVFQSWPIENRIAVLMRCIHSGLHDLALRIVQTDETLAVAEEDGETPLLALAGKPLKIYGTQRFWDNIANTFLSCLNMGVRNSRPTPSDAFHLFDHLWHNLRSQGDVETAQLPEHISQSLFTAVGSKNNDFMMELINRYPDLLYKSNSSQHTIFHIAILHRYVEVFNLLFEKKGVTDLMLSFIDEENNNILHLTAKLPQPNQLSTIPGAALQMQMEVLWYKEVEKIVPPIYITMKNKAGLTPYELFLEEHCNLMEVGEKQIKQLAKACMLVTTLITSIVFTTSFTVPGNYNDKGVPILRHRKFFGLLPLSEATAVLASLISMMMLLSVLTSNYSYIDFQRSLRIWLVLGLAALFISIGAMMVAFFSCLFFYGLGFSAVIVLLVLFACIPIIFLLLFSSLFFTIIRCTCSSSWLFKSNKQLFS